jgi:hypothetical protein
LCAFSNIDKTASLKHERYNALTVGFDATLRSQKVLDRTIMSGATGLMKPGPTII